MATVEESEGGAAGRLWLSESERSGPRGSIPPLLRRTWGQRHRAPDLLPDGSLPQVNVRVIEVLYIEVLYDRMSV